MNKKIIEMSHNVCYRRDNLRYHVGDIVSFLDDVVVVYGYDLAKGAPRYIVRDGFGHTMLTYEAELHPVVKVGDLVFADHVSGIVRKIKGDSAFIYCRDIKYGFWVKISDLKLIEG